MKKPTDWLNRLPTAAELLEYPQIKGLLDRVHRLEVTTGVRQFVDRLSREVSRRSLDMPIPSMGELAERAKRYILGQMHPSRQPAINATGQFWPAALSGQPLPEEAIAALLEGVQRVHRQQENAATAVSLAKAAGAEAGLITTNPTAALWLALAAMAERGDIVVARGELGTLKSGIRLTDLAEQAGATLREIGATDSVNLGDYDRAVQAGGAVLLRIESVPRAVADDGCRPSYAEVAQLAQQHGVPMIHLIGRGPLTPLPSSIPCQLPAISESIAQGTSLVIGQGDGFLGGPECGLIVGQSKEVAGLQKHPLQAVLQASDLTQAALQATLDIDCRTEERLQKVPILTLLTTSTENLRLRAERIAAQIAAQPGIARASAVEIPTRKGASYAEDCQAVPLASYGIDVVCHASEREQVARQLINSSPALFGHWEGDRLRLDLRTVFASDDIALVAAFELPAPATEAPSSQEVKPSDCSDTSSDARDRN